jgi:hypothetical protein
MLKEYEWYDVNFYAKQAVSSTKSYSAAIKYATEQCQIWDWSADFYSWTLYAIKTMYERKGGLTIGKQFDQEKVTKEINEPAE